MVHHTPDKGWRVQRLKHCNNNKVEGNISHVNNKIYVDNKFCLECLLNKPNEHFDHKTGIIV